jgi:FkbM family methyltransferase
LRSALPPRPTIVDAGANIGVSAVWLAAHYPGAALHCFEPEPANFGLLRHNLAGRANTWCEQAALGAREGTVDLFVTERLSDYSVFPPDAPATVCPVRAVRLADYLAGQGIERVDLLKLDVEGSEVDVLRGLADSIDDVGVIAGEVHERLVDQEEFYALLHSRGLRVVRRWWPRLGRMSGVHHFEAAR